MKKPEQLLPLESHVHVPYKNVQSRAKSVKEYLGGMNFAYVITVCTKAEENCPSTFPGQPVRLAWSFDDPAAFEGDDAAKLTKFREVRDQIRGQITGWLQTQQVA